MSNETGGPAFPRDPAFSDGDCDGMTMRDYFAAKALAALLSRINEVSGDYVTNATPDQAAESAYRYADAMLKARQE